LIHWWPIRAHECDTRKITKKYKSVISPILQDIFTRMESSMDEKIREKTCF